MVERSARDLQIEESLGVKQWIVKKINFRERSEEIAELVVLSKLSTENLENGDVWLVIEDKEKIVGCMTFETREDLVHIQSLCTDEQMRKKGIATALVEEAYNEYVKEGQTLIAMTMFWNNPVYEAMGFKHLDTSVKKQDDVGSRRKHLYCTVWGMEK